MTHLEHIKVQYKLVSSLLYQPLEFIDIIDDLEQFNNDFINTIQIELDEAIESLLLPII
jgi:hypothetical protein